MSDYQTFLRSKQVTIPATGKVVADHELDKALFAHQRDIVRWAVRKGRAAIFADVGLGKTLMQVETARLLGGIALIFAPLAVAFQTIEQARQHLDVSIRFVRSSAEIQGEGIYITNYEMLDHFSADGIQTVLLDESSILKNMTGVIKLKLVNLWKNTPYRFCFTATPAPNDVTELGSHAEFLGIMRQAQMTSIFFVHEAGVFAGVQESRWRLKRHAEAEFYRWLASWSVALKKPSDIGHSDKGYKLPNLNTHVLTVDANYTPPGMLPGFGLSKISAIDAKRIRRETIEPRAMMAAEMINASDDQWVVWTGLNDEADVLAECLNDSTNVYGSLSTDEKVERLLSFVSGKTRVLITKTSIAGMGINLQHCSKMLFFGIDFSWESYYQAVGRIYRFGQKAKSVDICVLISNEERPVYDVIERKGKDAVEMTKKLIAACQTYTEDELHGAMHESSTYAESEASGDDWKLLLGDSCERMAELPDNSVHLSVYSPPFSDMYIYNAIERDLSNSKDLDEFFRHYAFIIRENMRITMPGRLACVHVQDPKTFANREGYRGLRDFTGMVIEAYVNEGWIFRSRITIDKNPQIVASRNKDTDLLFVTGKRDATDLAPMATDYVLVFKKPGDNMQPVTPYANAEMTEQEWIEWAHAVWYDIRETDVLNVAVARDNDDEKHMCPLQLPLISRCLKLWSNPGETVFSPFAGIGSEGFEALKNRRKFIGIELKPSYFNVAQRNLRSAESMVGQRTLFDLQPEATAPEAAVKIRV